MPPGGMADCDHAREVEVEFRQEIYGVGDVLQGRRPATASPHPSVLDVASDPPAGTEVPGEVSAQGGVVSGSPEAPVDDDSDTKPVPGRKGQIEIVVPMGAVAVDHDRVRTVPTANMVGIRVPVLRELVESTLIDVQAAAAPPSLSTIPDRRWSLISLTVTAAGPKDSAKQAWK